VAGAGEVVKQFYAAVVRRDLAAAMFGARTA